VKEYPYWWDTLEPRASGLESQAADPKPRPSNVEPRTPSRVDVAIIGAGYTGLSAARALARAGASVVVLDRERVGWGASSRNGGQILTGLKLDAATLVDRYGEMRARALFDEQAKAIAQLESVIASESIHCEYRRCGHLQAAWKPSHFEAFRGEQALLARVFDHRVALVPPSEQRTEIATDRYHGLLVDEASAALNPVRYAEGLAAAARRAGVAVCSGAGVERLTQSGKRWTIGWRQESSRGSTDAVDVLVATNGYTTGVTPALQRRFIPIGSYIIATERLDPRVADALLPRKRVAFDSKHFLYYFRVTDDHRLLFGGRAEFGTPDADRTRRAAAILRDGMVDVFPQLAGVAVEYAWSGNVAFTRDEMPRAGMLDGLYYAGGYCGHGIAMASYLGDQIARRMAGELITNPLFDDRFAAIPMYSGAPWFLPIVGAYYQVKDWLQ
jgi:glycine/D-amino acid oxidase-like deaminating enzyme